MAARVHLSSTSMAFSHSMTIVTAGSAVDAALRVVFLAMAAPNIGSARRQASPSTSPVGRLVGFRLKSDGPSTIYLRKRNGPFAPREGDEMAEWNDPRTTSVNPAATVGVPRAARDAGLRSYMLSVYNYMASGVLLTGIIALLFAPYAGQVLVGPRGGLSALGWIVTLAPLGFVFAMSFGVNRMQTGTLRLLFWAFAAVMGLSMSTLFLAYTGVSIAQTFFATAV